MRVLQQPGVTEVFGTHFRHIEDDLIFHIEAKVCTWPNLFANTRYHARH